MRCLAVAAEARERDWEVTMSADLSALSWVRPWIESLGVEVVGAAETVESLISLVDSIQADAVLLDHYDFPDVLSAITGKGVVLANFEDGQFGRRAAHLSIDYTLGAESVNRPDDGSLTCLRGIRFAPIRAEVRAGRPLPREPLPGRPMVAVLLGGTDAHELATRVSALVEQVGAHTQVIEGALTFVSQLRPIDAVVSAAGVSAYELACLGIPTALLQVVDNQGANYVAMVGAGAATGLGTAAELHGKPTLVAERLRVWLSDPALLSSIAKVAQQLVDGQGISRIVAALDATSESLSRP
jgi:spore coat polysaccharide biosynthesis predicted glycosyltransferase SpsG